MLARGACATSNGMACLLLAIDSVSGLSCRSLARVGMLTDAPVAYPIPPAAVLSAFHLPL
jgi:hypothetical protein